MPMHYWSETNFDWKSLDQACCYIGEGLRKWRVDVRQWKEKYGECRVYCSLGLFCFQQLRYPGYVSNQWPKWAWHLEFTRPAMALRWVLNLFIVPLHKYLYRSYYAEAVRRWPHIREEILDAADYPELLERL